jgi:tRNA-intron endonuclease
MVKRKAKEKHPEAPIEGPLEEAEKVETTQQTPLEQIKLTKPIKGHLIGNKVAVTEDFQLAQPFYDRSSFGEIHGVKEQRIEYALEEALYLIERGKLKVFDGKKTLKFKDFVQKANKSEKNFWTRYQVYRDIRTRGYITKTALKFGADFRVYPRGVKPGQDHAKWVLFATAEGDSYTWRQFAAMNRVAHSTRKSLLVGIVDAEGEITYYTVRWTKP